MASIHPEGEMRCSRAAAIILLLGQVVAAPALAGHRKAAGGAPIQANVTIAPLDRVADAVDGAESSHGSDQAMWRPDPAGPQGPMQVSDAAATDVGGGDRFDMAENREIGRAYLAHLYRRYGNWPDAIAAYNWGIGHLDNWVRAGRPADGLEFGVVAYLGRVLRDSGLCDSAPAKPSGKNTAADAYCSDLGALGAVVGNGRPLPNARSRQFFDQLDKAGQLAAARIHSR